MDLVEEGGVEGARRRSEFMVFDLEWIVVPQTELERQRIGLG